jgi:hypothetical protein
MKKDKNSVKNKSRLVLEGAARAIDISGSFSFNSYKEYNPHGNIEQIWINVGKYLGESISLIESEKRELVIHE